MKRMRAYALLLAIVFTLSCAGCSGDGENNELRVGLLAVSSGELFRKGGYISRGASLAAEKVNAQGGVKVEDSRIKVRLVFADSGDNPDIASRAALKLIEDEHVDAIVGAIFSPVAVAAAGICEKKRIPLITPSAGTRRLTPLKYVFRVSYTNRVQGKALAIFAAGHFNKEPVAVLFAGNHSYSCELSEYFRKDYEKLGGSIAAFVSYPPGIRQYKEQMEQVADSDAKVLFLPGNTKKVQIQAAQARKAGFEGALLGGDSWDPVELARNPLFAGSYFADHWRPGLPVPESVEFEKEFYKKNNVLPTELEALSYDAVMSLFAAVNYGGSTDPSDIRDSLSEMPPYRGVTGKFDYNNSGDPEKDVFISRLEANGTVLSEIIYTD